MSIEKSKVLGILGGLGPMATAYFYELVIAHTKAERDQDHIDMVISSKATTPDRTAYITGQSNEDPFGIMESEAHRLVTFGAEVIAIPCNTAHYFFTRLHEVIPIPVLNMVELTVEKAAALGCGKVGILATDGTICTDTYQHVCMAKHLACEVPGAAGQADVMQVIYRDIKGGRPPEMAAFHRAAEELFSAGCQRLILGCTELSLLKKDGLLDERYLDSMDVLAEAAIAACGKTPVGFAWPPV
ncbi:amino acid racemase [Ruminococcaceae bacterium OttesenSCG-928-O06]|nr:amino acid racemase [Ruminococcaceae bacterium OttesenSCG-928-O06]